jgi:uncharacterized protein (DUF58 family)
MAVLASALAVFALFLDDSIAFIAAAVLSLTVLYRAALFDHSLRKVIRSLKVDRRISAPIQTPGGTIQVVSRIRGVFPPHLSIAAYDVIPLLTAVRDEEPAYTRDSGNSWIARYPLTMAAPGDTRFGGILLTASDPFFERTIRYHTRADDQVLQILPAKVFLPEDTWEWAEGENEREDERNHYRLFRGQDTLSFRPFQEGDDPRFIDPKLSAKHDRDYIRENSSLVGKPPLIVVDLPENHQEPDADSFAHFAAVVNTAIEGSLSAFEGYSLMLVSGSQIVGYYPRTNGMQHLYEHLRAIRPVDRQIHLFRERDPVILRSDIRRIEREISDVDDASVFKEMLCKTWRSSMKARDQDEFRGCISRIISDSGPSELYLYSLLSGDLSHIRKIIIEAKKQQRLIHIRVADPYPDIRAVGELKEYDVDSLEAV